MDIFDKLAKNIKFRVKNTILRLKAYFKRLIFPLYLFPIKIITYSAYYLIKFEAKFIFAFLRLFFEIIVFPFKSLKNFLKSVAVVVVFVYIVASLFVIIDYLSNYYGDLRKYFCVIERSKLQNSVVRVVGGHSEGSGFFIAEDQVLTNFHVISYEVSPKVILPSGEFVLPTKIVGDKNADLAVIFTEKKFPEMVFKLPDNVQIIPEETLLSIGYPLGTGLSGRATILKGKFIDFRKQRSLPVRYLQTDINLVKGMSGGPVTDLCGQVVGINTLGLAGLSLFIVASDAKSIIPNMTDRDTAKIEVDPSVSPEEAVRAFYTYLKARRMEDGFNLLSKEYLNKTNFEEWTSRFKDVLDVDVVKVEKYEDSKDTVFVKFTTKNWIDGEVEMRFYEGTWQTVKEDGVYKMNKSKIKEIPSPDWLWFYF